MHTYSAYGLTICSELKLPELPAAPPTPPDVFVRLGPVAPPPGGAQGPASFRFEPDAAYLSWGAVGSFLVRGGREIVIDPRPGADAGLLRLPLVGTVLGVLLHQRGRFCLHASAVADAHAAILFVGPKGSGKSTTAAAFVRAGYTLATDDIAALEPDGRGGALLLPGARQLKLWPDALATTFGAAAGHAPLAAGLAKYGVAVAAGPQQGPLPIRRLYLLDWGPEAAVEPLPQQEQLLTLLGNSYMAPFGRRLLDGAAGRQHFAQGAALQRAVPVRRLRRPPELARLPEVVAAAGAEAFGRPLGSIPGAT